MASARSMRARPHHRRPARRAVAQLRCAPAQGIAHRWLTAEPPAADRLGPSDGRRPRDLAGPVVTLIDFRWAVHQASPAHLGGRRGHADRQPGHARGRGASGRRGGSVLRPDELADALPLVQPLALPGDVQRAIAGNKAHPSAGPGSAPGGRRGRPYELADIERVGPSRSPRSWAASSSCTRCWASPRTGPRSRPPCGRSARRSSHRCSCPGGPPLPLGRSDCSPVVPKPLPFGEAVELMFAQSFLNRFTPANSGGMALRVRYLQKRGVDLGGAAAGVGLTSVASGICQW